MVANHHPPKALPMSELINIDHFQYILKDPSQAHLCYCFDLKFAIKLLVERDKTSTVQLVKI